MTTTPEQRAEWANLPLSASGADVVALISHIEALEAENARLKEALKPFARLKRVFAGKVPDDAPNMPDSHAYNLVWNMDNGRCDLTLGQFRRARAAMGESE